jgi:hypothetical protein
MNNSKKPFLTLLCILTFIGSAFFILSSANGLLSNTNVDSEQMEDIFDQVKDQIEASAKSEAESAQAMEMINKIVPDLVPEKIKTFNVFILISSLFTMVGAALMWGLNKKGFYVYILGTLILCISPLIIFESLIGISFAVFFGFIGVIFSLLYFFNFKDIK